MSEIQKIIGKNIEKARVIRKVSLAELAARLGISKNKLKKYESGLEFQPDEILSDITKDLDISLNFILFVPKGEISVIRLKNSDIPERDKDSVLEIAKYKAELLDSFISYAFPETLPPIKKYTFDSAEGFAEEIATECLSYKNLTDFLKSKRIFITSISVNTALFKGLFIKKNKTSIIMVPKKYVSDDDLFHIIVHELCHALIYQQQENHLLTAPKNEEKFCVDFSKSFIKKCLSSKSFNLGNINFLEEKIIDSWKNDKITTSLAAELLETSAESFRENYTK